MATRTSEGAVRLIIDTTLDADAIEQFIADASLWVDNTLAGDGLSAATLEAIERYLTAGFMLAKTPRAKSKKLGDVSATYETENDYFNRAADLDPTNKVRSAFLPGRRRGLFRVGAGYDDDHTSAGI